MARLYGKTALITGGTTGIGLATAKLFQKEGAQVAITGQSESRLSEARSELGSEAVVIQADTRHLPQIETLMTQVKNHLGSIDILFINAGIVKFSPLANIEEKFFDEIMDINLKGAFFTIQRAAPIMRDNGSIIINTSINNQIGMLGSSIYAASKAALRSLARTLSAEFIEKGIRVNAVSPGPVTTPLYQKLGFPQEQLEQMAGQLQEKIPMHRFGEPEEIARAALFLAAEDSSFVLGAELVVDGGMSQL